MQVTKCVFLAQHTSTLNILLNLAQARMITKLEFEFELICLSRIVIVHNEVYTGNYLLNYYVHDDYKTELVSKRTQISPSLS